MYKNKTALLLAGLLAGPVWSQEEAALDPRAELAEYVRYAEQHNPKLKQALTRYQAALAKVPAASAWVDPRLTYGYFARPVETRTGPQEMRFSAAQTFPWKGKLKLKGRIAEQEAAVEGQRYEAVRRSLIFAVKAAYYDYYFLQRAIAVTEDNLRLLAHSRRGGPHPLSRRHRRARPGSQGAGGIRSLRGSTAQSASAAAAGHGPVKCGAWACGDHADSGARFAAYGRVGFRRTGAKGALAGCEPDAANATGASAGAVPRRRVSRQAVLPGPDRESRLHPHRRPGRESADGYGHAQPALVALVLRGRGTRGQAEPSGRLAGRCGRGE